MLSAVYNKRNRNRSSTTEISVLFPKEVIIMSRKEDTPERQARRRYELKNKELRKATSANFQAMMPRALYTEINEYLASNGISKVDFIRFAFESLKSQNGTADASYGM